MTDPHAIIARAIDPEAWQYSAPVPTRVSTEEWHLRRQESGKDAKAVTAALAEAGWAIVPVAPASIARKWTQLSELDRAYYRAKPHTKP